MALIYVVEDDDNIREIETIALKNSNYLVKAFARATDFYRALNDILPDLVLMDVMLPDENGCDIVRRLRSQSATKRLPVIMVTAKTSEMDMVKGLDDGADDYIKKPFSVLELLSGVLLLSTSSADTSEGVDAGSTVVVCPPLPSSTAAITITTTAAAPRTANSFLFFALI